MKILPLNFTNFPKNSKTSFNKNFLKPNDLKCDCVSFSSRVYATKTKIPEIDVLNGVTKSFSKRATKTIKEFPKKWLFEFKNQGYKIILSPSLKAAYEKQGVYDPVAEFFEKNNPNGTLGAIYDGRDKNSLCKFFAFCDKPPYSNRFMKNIINHELCHGVADIQKLSSNPQVLSLIQKDCKTIVEDDKLYKLTFPERRLINYHFFDKNAYLPIEEIIADTYAWIIGEGIYGSELTLPDKNPNLMKTLFPSLYEYLLNI